MPSTLVQHLVTKQEVVCVHLGFLAKTFPGMIKSTFGVYCNAMFHAAEAKVIRLFNMVRLCRTKKEKRRERDLSDVVEVSV